MKALITGISGMLGSNMAFHVRDKWNVVGTYMSHPIAIPGTDCRLCDNRDYDAVAALIESVNPELIIHCVANTNMDAQESDPDGAYRVNVLSTTNVINAIKGSSARLVYISTDAVYPGTNGPYAEDDEVRPLSVYGKTKLEAEEAAAEAGALCLRTNLYGWNAQNKPGLAEWFINTLKENGTANGFEDIWFSGIYTKLFTDILSLCLDQSLTGIFNCASRDGWTKYEFGRRVAQRLMFPDDSVRKVNSSTVQFKAPRGTDMRLDVTALESILDIRLPTMEDSFAEFMNDMEDGLDSVIRSASIF